MMPLWGILVTADGSAPADSCAGDARGEADAALAAGADPARRRVKIEHVFYAGDEGGIVCSLAFPGAGSQVVVISLTHVRIAATHPLADAIRDYQRTRVQKLSQGV